MKSTQISLVLPTDLHQEARSYSGDLGFRSVQEFILDALRRRVVQERRLRLIEERMRRGKGVRSFSQEEARKFLESI